MIFIIVSHLSNHLGRTYGIGIPLLGYGGTWGNSIFLFLSGYGMYMSMTKRENLHIRYLWQHIVKIIVPFVIAFVATLIGVAIIGDNYNWSDAIGQFFTMTIPYTREWFLKAIIMLYVFSFVAFRLSHRSYPRVLIISLFSLVYCFIGYYVGIGSWMYNTILSYPAGMLVAMNQSKLNRVNWGVPFFISAILFFFFLNFQIPFVNCLLYGLALTMTLIYTFKISGIGSRFLRFMGVNSILFYLFHIGFVHVHYSPYIDPILTISIATVLTFIYINCKQYIDRFIVSIS